MHKTKHGFPEHHRLGDLWDVCRPLAEEFWPRESLDPLNEIETTLKEFQQHDPKGQDFRYSARSDGTRTTPELTHVNIEAFYDKATEAYRLLDGMSTAFEEAWQVWADNQP